MFGTFFLLVYSPSILGLYWTGHQSYKEESGALQLFNCQRNQKMIEKDKRKIC